MVSKILEISTTNVLLKNEDEQLNIVYNFAKLLDSIKGQIQILYSSSKYNLRDKKTKIKNEEYDKFLKKIISSNNILQRDFKMIISDENESVLNNQVQIIERYIKQCQLLCNIVNFKEVNYEIDEIHKDYMTSDKYCYQTFYIGDYPRYCYFGWLEDLYNSNMNLDIGMFITPIPNYESIKYLEHKVAVNLANVSINEDYDRLSDEYDEYIISAMHMRDEIFKNEGKMYFISLYITIKGKNRIELIDTSQKLKFLLKSKGISIYSCFLRQDDGYLCTRPNNKDILLKTYNITTRSLKYFFPFVSSHIVDEDGVFIGLNLLTPGLIFLNPFKYNSALMFVLGKVGGGKTYLIQLLTLRMAYMDVEIDIWDKTKFEYLNIMKLTNLKNIRVHCYDTIEEYEMMMENYIKLMKENVNSLKQRFLVIDEGWQFLKDSEKICDMINEISLTGRKYFQGLCFVTQMIEHLQDERILSVLRESSIKVLMQMEINSAKVVQKELCLTNNEVRFLSSANQEGILIAGSNRTQFKAMATKKEDEIITTDPNKRKMHKAVKK